MDRLQDLRLLIEPVVAAMGFCLVDLVIHGKGPRTIVRVFIDKVGGVTIDHCVQASRAIEEVLEQREFFHERYVLEVSSPGTDRPLQSEQEFQRHVGRKVKVIFNAGENVQEITGIIDSVADGMLVLSTAEGLKLLDFANVIKGKLVVELKDRF